MREEPAVPVKLRFVCSFTLLSHYILAARVKEYPCIHVRVFSESLVKTAKKQ